EVLGERRVRDWGGGRVRKHSGGTCGGLGQVATTGDGGEGQNSESGTGLEHRATVDHGSSLVWVLPARSQWGSGRFPGPARERVWVPGAAGRDWRYPLWHYPS